MSSGNMVEGLEGQQQHGRVVLAYLGHGEVAGDAASVHALLAVHRGEWSGCGVAAGSGGGFYRAGTGVSWTGRMNASMAHRRELLLESEAVVRGA